MGPELALAIDAAVIENAALVVKIYQTIREVASFKKRCKALGSEAETLQILLDSRRSAVDSINTLTQIQACLNEIFSFVNECKAYSIVARAHEVLIRKRYVQLMKEIGALKNMFLFESVTEILKREGELRDGLQTLQTSNRTEHTRQIDTLDELKARSKALENQLARLNLSTNNSVVRDRSLFLNERLNMTFDDGQTLMANATSNTLGKITCHKIDLDRRTQAALQTYLSIQNGAFVQRLYGLTESNDQVYAVMESKQDMKSLSEALSQGDTFEQDRLRLAYDLAKSMAWYHRAELLMKSISDHSVVLKQGLHGKRHCCITGLQHARLFLEKTSGIRYDIRYEAPEYEDIAEHNQGTDIWSLGTILWQLFAAKFPYNAREFVPADSPEALSLLKCKRDGVLPGQLSTIRNTPSHQVSELISQCWDHDPFRRPTASFVANKLQVMIIKQATLHQARHPAANDDDTVTDGAANIPEGAQTIRSQIMNCIKASRKDNVNSNSTSSSSSAAGVASADFEKLLDHDDWDAQKYFLVGAAIFWNIVDSVKSGSDFSWLDTVPPTNRPYTLTTSNQNQRLDVALYFLESAAADGFEEAYYEVYKAHSAIAREFHEKSKRTRESLSRVAKK